MSDPKWLEEIERRNAQRTQGKWTWVEDKFRGGYSGIAAEDGSEILYPNAANDGDEGAAWFEDFPKAEDAEFIVRAPQDISALTKALEVAIGALEKTTITLANCDGHCLSATRANDDAVKALAEIERMGRNE